MASLVLGGIGAAIGGVVAGPTGAQLGWSLGSMAGSLLDPQKLPTQYGPRLGDLKVTTSTYGSYIPRLYGTTRVSGNIIWSTPIIETEHETEQGGKGGPSQESVEYTYSLSFAVAVHDGVLSDLKQIIANGKTIYNAGSTDVETVLASTRIADGITFYKGTEDQLPSSLIQSYEGVENTPAFRGTAYVLFENMQLAEYGNRPPNLEFVLVKNGDSTSTALQINNLRYIAAEKKYPFFFNIGPYSAISTINQYQQKVWLQGTERNADGNEGDAVAILYNLYINDTVSNSFLLPVVTRPPEGMQRDLLTIPNKSKSNDSSTVMTFALPNFNRRYYYNFGNNGGLFDLGQFYTGTSPNIFDMGSTQVISDKTDKYMCMTDYFGTNAGVGPTNLWLFTVGNNSFTEMKQLPINYMPSDLCITDDYIYVLGNDAGVPGQVASKNIYKYDFNLNLLSTITNTVPLTAFYDICAGNNNDVYVTYNGIVNMKIYNVSSGSLEYVIDFPESDIDRQSQRTNKLFYYNNNFYFSSSLISSLQQNLKTYIITPVVNSNDIPLTEVVTDICESSGLLSSQIDVTSLSGIMVKGYLLTSRMTARAALEPLMKSYFFDAVESDGKVKFVKRGMDAVITINEDDLSASSYGSELPDQLNTDRKQQLDLPEEITVGYMDINNSYQIVSQYSRRLIANTQNKSSVELPMVFNANEAKTIADIMLYNYWQERTGFGFSVSNKYLYLDVTDVINVVKNNKTYNMRLIDQNYQNGIISFSGVEEDKTIYDTESVGAEVIPENSEVKLRSITNLKLLDIPLLRDQDDKVGYYVAASGFTSGWTGCQVYKSSDNGGSFNTFGSVITKESVIGQVGLPLGNFSSGNIFDEINILNVTTNLPLFSITELQVLNGGNVALVGNEIIQFKNATLVAENTYNITGMIRGKFGTDINMSTHQSGETFVLLTPATTYLQQSINTEYNLERLYKGVSFNTFINEAENIVFTNTAKAQKPYAPVNIYAGRNSSDGIVIYWTRRSRIGGQWSNFTDIPLGEDIESYSIDIMSNGTPSATVLRTLTSSSTSTTSSVYTSAQQIADFGSIRTQGTLNIRVYQISSLVGRGFAGVAIV